MKRLLLNLTLAATSLLLALLVAEGALRMTARWRPVDLPQLGGEQPTWLEPDPELGWWLKPGFYVLNPLGPTWQRVRVTIAPDRSRRTRSGIDWVIPARRPELLTLGCSFTFGQDVTDEATWPWRLQQLRPDLDVRNHGTPAYGTYQSLLLLERILAGGERPRHVIYGFIPQHGIRNVGDPYWQVVLATLSRTPVALPYGTLDGDGRLVRHPARTYPSWPVQQYSAVAKFLEWKWMERTSATRQLQEIEVTRQLVQAMDDVCRRYGVRFSLLVLVDSTSTRGQLGQFARARGIEVIDCARDLTPAEVIPGGHPNGKAHAAWAECLAAALSQPVPDLCPTDPSSLQLSVSDRAAVSGPARAPAPQTRSRPTPLRKSR